MKKIDTHQFPACTGVYLMRDKKSQIIYVGKAKNLRKRITSYFRVQAISMKISILMSKVQKIDYILTVSEAEALIVEESLIKQIQPIYNTMWKDDKSMPYVAITNEDYPRMIYTRKKNLPAKYFGPFPYVGQIKKMMSYLFYEQNNLYLRFCKYKFNKNEVEQGLEKTNPSLHKKVLSCIYLHTSECVAPCVKKISFEDYHTQAQEMILLFQKGWDSWKKKLSIKMKEASQKLNFELAIKLRDQIHCIEKMSEPVLIQKISIDDVIDKIKQVQGLNELKEIFNLSHIPLHIEAFDISNNQGQHPVASMVVFKRGLPAKKEYRKYRIKTVIGINDFQMIREVVYRRYKRLSQNKIPFPDLILVDGGKGQISSAHMAIQHLRREGYKIPHINLISLAKKEEEIFSIQTKNPLCLKGDSKGLHILQHIRDEAHRFAINFYRFQHRKHNLLSETKKK